MILNASALAVPVCFLIQERPSVPKNDVLFSYTNAPTPQENLTFLLYEFIQENNIPMSGSFVDCIYIFPDAISPPWLYKYSVPSTTKLALLNSASNLSIISPCVIGVYVFVFSGNATVRRNASVPDWLPFIILF